jgi:outer membrane receptor protein involved in Fe transport
MRKPLIGVVGLVVFWGVDARAQVVDSQDDASTHATSELSDADLAALAEKEALDCANATKTSCIRIYDERPDKPFDRDTEVRLTGEQLAERGATDLATALALIPEITVRDAGRGGFNIDIRGGRKGAVSILIDGVAVNDPYYGTFDVSTIPITDIVQIRVSTTPKSPIDGPGGPGGVVEVLTRDAIGPQVVVARVLGDSLPTFGTSGTARVALAKHLGLRVAATGLMGARDMELPGDAKVGEARRAATGSVRLEYRKGDRRVVADGFLDDRHYISPPSESNKAGLILMVDRETTLRLSSKVDEKFGNMQLQAQGWGHSLARRSRYFNDASLDAEVQMEDMRAQRFGGMALVTKPFLKDFRWAVSATLDHEQANVTAGANTVTGEVTLVSTALDLQYERRKLRLDAAGGIAVPQGLGADPWPEGKLSAKLKPAKHFELTATTGYKGRVPTLRERFDLANGNAALGPEQALHAELRAIEQLDGLRIEVAPFYRQTYGTVRASPEPADMGKLVNLGELDFYGIDLQGRVTIAKSLEVGGSYNYIRAKSDTSDEPLDRLPRHRADGWVQYSPFSKVAMLGRARYAGKAIDRGMPTDEYTLLEATVTSRITREYLGVLKIEDIVDIRPETRMGYRMPGRTISVVFQGTWE